MSVRFAAAGTTILILPLLLFPVGCTLLRKPASQPKAQLKSLQLATNGAAGPVTLRSLQIEVMRFADNYAAVVARASDDFSELAKGPEARLAAARWKLEEATAAYIDASGPNPVINALDMVVLASASRMVMEEQSKEPPFGGAAAALLDTHRLLETNSWSLVSSVLKPDQQRELREIILEWRKRNPQQRNVAGLRFREFISALGISPQRSSSSPTSLFSLLFLDPMASMDPTTAAIEETRNTAERAMYYTQRMPSLLNWQVELFTYELAVQPETKQVLADTARFSKSGEAFAKAAENLPNVIRQEREAAIKQVLEGLVPEEKRVKELLGEARALATETRETLKAGTATADSIKTAIKALDDFVRSVSKTNDSGSATNRRPYDVLDYATAAREIGGAARELTALLVSANASSVKLAELRRQTAADANGVVDYAFKRALALVLVLVCTVLLAAVAYRAMSARGHHSATAPGADCQK